MQRILWLIAVILIFVVGYQWIQNSPTSNFKKPASDFPSRLSGSSTALPPETTLPSRPQRPTPAQSDERQQLQTEILNLQNELQDQTATLERERQTLRDLQNQQTEKQRELERISLNSPVRREAEQNQILSLQDNIDFQRQAEDDLQSAAEASRDQQIMANEAHISQINQSLQNLGAQISQTEAQIQKWNSYTFDLTEKANQLDQLNLLLAQEKQQQQDLRNQKLISTSVIPYQMQNITQQKRATQSDLIDAQNSAQIQIESLRDQMEREQYQQDQLKAQVSELKTQISQVQNDVTTRSESVKELQDQLKQKQERLNQLQ